MLSCFLDIRFPFIIGFDYCTAYECLNQEIRCTLTVVVSSEVDSLFFACLLEGIYTFGRPLVEKSLTMLVLFRSPRECVKKPANLNFGDFGRAFKISLTGGAKSDE